MGVTSPLVEVEIIESEVVQGRGTARVDWLARKADGWVRAAEVDGAVVERRDAGPGTVWERAIRCTLPVGAELLRVEVRPGKEVRRDPLDYLQKGRAGASATTVRRLYRVTRRGTVRPVEPPAPR